MLDTKRKDDPYIQAMRNHGHEMVEGPRLSVAEATVLIQILKWLCGMPLLDRQYRDLARGWGEEWLNGLGEVSPAIEEKLTFEKEK